MKHLLHYLGVLAICVAPFSASHAQTTNSLEAQLLTPKDEIIEVYGKDWVSSNAVMVEVLVECRSNRISFIEEIQTETEKYPVLSSFPVMNKLNSNVQAVDPLSFDLNTFNPFTYQLNFLSDKMQVIRIDGTRYLMVVNPIK